MSDKGYTAGLAANGGQTPPRSPAQTAQGLSGGGFVPGTDRLPPQNLEAEMSLLGSMMLAREVVGDIIQIITKSDSRWFYRPDHRILFEVLVDLYDTGQPIDIVVLRNELQQRKVLNQVGGTEYLVACAESVPSAANAENYAKIIRDKGVLRDLITCVGAIEDDAYGQAVGSAEILDRAEQQLFAVTEQRISSQSVGLNELVSSLKDELMEGVAGLNGVPSGFTELDELTTGFQPGDMIVLAARPSMGKTALGLNMCEHIAVDVRKPVVFFSMEMSRQQVAQRILCSRARIDSHKFRKRMLDENEKQKALNVLAELHNAPLYIDDTPGMSPMELRAKARRLRMQKGIEAVFVDYLQLMHEPGSESRQQEISSISRNLKGLGRELGIPIIALAQLNRMAEGRQGNQPRMSDLRESGAIEQDADAVLLIHREEYYNRDDPTLKGKAELIIAKQRNGPTDIVTLSFDHQSTRFNNYSPIPDSGYADYGPGDATPY